MADENSNDPSPSASNGHPRRRFDIDSPAPAPHASEPRVDSHVELPRFRVPNGNSTRSFANDRWMRMMVTTIAAILVMGTMYFASSLLVPVVIAALAYLSLRPIEARICQWGVPQAAASGTLIVGLFSTLALIVALLYSPAQQWIVAAPESLAEVRSNFRSIAEPLTTLDRAEDTVDGVAAPLQDDKPRIDVAYEKPSSPSRHASRPRPRRSPS